MKSCAKATRTVCFALLLLLVFLYSPSSAGEMPRYIRLTILHTNDVHGHFMPFDYNGELNVGGIARRATMIERIKAESPGSVLVMDAGDVYTRGPLCLNYLGKPDIEAMNAVPYDIMTLGNNEFKARDGMDGQKTMIERIKQARFPVVCANVVEKATGNTLVPPYTVLNISGVRVGIFGLTARCVASYLQAEGLSILDPIETAKRMVEDLRDKCDVLVALTHIGAGTTPNEGYDQDLAKALPEIDVIVGGDSHTWIREPVLVRKGSTPHAFWVGGPVIVQDGEWGHSLGRLDLILRRSKEHDYQVMSYKGMLIPVTGETPARRDVEHLLAPYVAKHMKPVGRLDRDIPDGMLDSHVIASMMKKTGAEVGLMDSWTIAGSLRSGPVTMFDIYSVVAFRNDVVKMDVTASQIKAAVKELGSDESAVMVGAKITPEGKLLVGDREVGPNDTVTLATSSFDASLKAFVGVKAESAGVNLVELICQDLKN